MSSRNLLGSSTIVSPARQQGCERAVVRDRIGSALPGGRRDLAKVIRRIGIVGRRKAGTDQALRRRRRCGCRQDQLDDQRCYNSFHGRVPSFEVWATSPSAARKASRGRPLLASSGGLHQKPLVLVG